MSLTQTIDTVRRSRFAMPLAVLAALVLLIGNEVGHQRARAVIDAGEDTLVGRTEVSRLLRLMLGAESGQRGYLLTGRPEYREPYLQSTAEVESLLARIRLAYQDQPERIADIRRLEELTRQKLAELATTMKLHDEGKEDAWRNLLLTDIGREKMQGLEQLARSIAAQETVKLDSSRYALTRTLLVQRIGIALLVVLSLAALLMYLDQSRRVARNADEQRAALQAERDKLEAEVARRTEELTRIARHLQTAREDERSRLARELHDELGGLLTAAKLDVARMRSKLAGGTPDVADRIAHLVKTLDAGIALKRRIIEDLRPSSLQNLGLKAALEIMTAEFAHSAAVHLECHVDDEVALGNDESLSVYRLVQEALTNIAKYAAAHDVRVRVEAVDDGVRVSVEDDGAGFDTTALTAGVHGLAGMRFRIESHGGRLQVTSAPGEGTTIVAFLPTEAVVAVAA